MKCPKCGVTNGKTNKFCRDCGKKLDWPIEQVEQNLAQISGPLDDLTLGEELFSIMKIYDDGDVQAAGERIQKIIEHNPDSASAHSILALIYERMAEFDAAAGSAQTAQRYLQLAVEEYEHIIALNPRSAADREKLIGVRMKLAGRTAQQHSTPQPQPSRASTGKSKAKAFLLRVPAPVLASTAAFVVITILVSTLMFRGDEKKPQAVIEPAQPVNGVQASTPVNTPPNAMTTTNPPIEIYKYPSTQSTPVPNQPQQLETPKVSSQTVEPIKLPRINPELILVAERSKPAQTKAVVRVEETPKAKPAPEPVETVSDQPSGSNLLAKAITLGNQGKNSEAINSAEQAVALFQADIAAGRNTTSAQRGMDNANKYIQLWRSTE